MIDPAEPSTSGSDASRLVELLRSGRFVAALQDPLGAELLGPINEGCAQTAGRVRSYVAAGPEAVAAVAALAGAALSLFAQLNWTGPPAAEGLEACPHAADVDEVALRALEVDTEQPYQLLRAPGLLRAARALLLEPLEALEAAEPGGYTALWWAARCAMLHQRVLDRPA